MEDLIEYTIFTLQSVLTVSPSGLKYTLTKTVLK